MGNVPNAEVEGVVERIAHHAENGGNGHRFGRAAPNTRPVWHAVPPVSTGAQHLSRQNARHGDRREQVTRRLPRGLSDEELRAVARWVVGAYLEVERGHRDVRVLRPFLAPHLYFGLENAERRPGSAPVAAGDVGGAHFNRLGAGKGYAAVVVRDADGRWRAVTLVLRRDDAGAWQVVDLRRVHSSATSPSSARVGEDAGSMRSNGGLG